VTPATTSRRTTRPSPRDSGRPSVMRARFSERTSCASTTGHDPQPASCSTLGRTPWTLPGRPDACRVRRCGRPGCGGATSRPASSVPMPSNFAASFLLNCVRASAALM
jgi:hypothetical protein